LEDAPLAFSGRLPRPLFVYRERLGCLIRRGSARADRESSGSGIDARRGQYVDSIAWTRAVLSPNGVPLGQLGSPVGCPPAIAGLGETLPDGQGPRVYGAGSVLLYPPNRGPIPLWWSEVWSGSQDAVTHGNGGTGTFGSGHERRPPANRGPPSVTRLRLDRALSATASAPHVDSCEGHQRDDQEKAGQERPTRGGGWRAEGRVRGAGRWCRSCGRD